MKFTHIGAQPFIDGKPVSIDTLKAMHAAIVAEEREAYDVYTAVTIAEADEYDRRRARTAPPHYTEDGWRSVVPVAS